MKWLKELAAKLRAKLAAPLRARLCADLALAVALVAAASPAHAQAVLGGGGGGGALSAIIQWFMQNIAVGLVMGAVIMIGLIAMAGRLGLLIVAGVCVGAVIIGNYSTIATTLTSAFGG